MRSTSCSSATTLASPTVEEGLVADRSGSRSLKQRLNALRRTSTSKSALTLRSAQPDLTEEYAPDPILEDTDTTPGSEREDPLAEERRKAKETIAAFLPEALRDRQEVVTEDPRVRLATVDDDLDPYVLFSILPFKVN